MIGLFIFSFLDVLKLGISGGTLMERTPGVKTTVTDWG